MRHLLLRTFGSRGAALASACFAAAALAYSSHAGAAVYPTSNLLTNPGFETNTLANFTNVAGLPYQTNVWGQEASTIVTAIAGVTPNGPTHMLSMTTDGGVLTQTLQSVDVSAYSTDINANLVTANFNALFTTDKSIQAGVAGIFLQFFNASHTIIGPTNGNSLTLDASQTTWEQISVTNIPVPANTNYLLAQVFYNNASMTTATGANEAGYVDDAVLTLDRATTPEPSSLLAALPAGALLLIRKRRLIA